MSNVDKIYNNAKDFQKGLMEISVMIDADIEKFIRYVILRVFMKIVEQSPVRSGAFRASHGITTFEPDENEGIHEGFTSDIDINAELALEYAKNKIKDWDWKLEQNQIIIFNNLPYAEAIEDGHSGQAPEGVYSVTLAEFNAIFEEELKKFKNLR